MFEREIAQLAIVIRQTVTKCKQEHSVATRRVLRIRRRDFTLKYHEDFAFGNLTPERIEEDAWDHADVIRFYEDVVKNLEEYKSLAAAVGSKGSALDHFVRSLCYASYSGLDDKNLQTRIDAFARESADKPLPVKVMAFIDGFSASDAPLVLSDRLVFRRPTPEDLSETVFVDEYGGFSFPLPEARFRIIGEFTFDAVEPGAAQEQLLRTIDALRLFRVGGVRASRYRMASLHPLGDCVMGGGHGHSRFTYGLSREDIVSLNDFLKEVVPLLPNAFSVDEDTRDVAIAYTRYRDALFQAGSERTITLAVTSLEALFLKNEPGTKRTLAQRVSLFLRELGTQVDAQETYDRLRQAYSIRSDFVHGESLKPEKRPAAESLARIVLEYARESVLARLQMSIGKDELLRQLDRAMIDPAGLTDLRVSIGRVVHH